MADNYYRINNMSAAKLDIFYDNSIKSRILFIKKILLVAATADVVYKKDIRVGYFTFLKIFVLARYVHYIEEISQITDQLIKAKVLTQLDSVKLKIIFKLFLSTSPFIKKLKLKGLAYKII